MFEMDEFLSKALMDSAMHNAVAIQMVHSEWKNSFRYRVDDALDLLGSGAPFHALVGKRSHHRAGLGVPVGVIEVIMRVAAVEQDGMLNEPLTHHLGEEVQILLRAGGACCEMVDSDDRVIHKIAASD